MSKSKVIIYELSSEDLAKIATGSDEEVIYDKITEAAKFIYALGIKHGKERISAQLLYYHYREWKGWGNKKQSKGPFFRDFNKYFESTRGRDGKLYFLDPKPFDLSKETWWEMRAQLRNEKTRKKQKLQKK